MKSWDVIVIGSGAAGFAAVTACCKGLSVLMLERSRPFRRHLGHLRRRRGCTIPTRGAPRAKAAPRR